MRLFKTELAIIKVTECIIYITVTITVVALLLFLALLAQEEPSELWLTRYCTIFSSSFVLTLICMWINTITKQYMSHKDWKQSREELLDSLPSREPKRREYTDKELEEMYNISKYMH